MSIPNGDMESCTARAIDSAVEPVSLTLSKVTFGRSSSSLSLLMCLGDRPLGSVCALPWLLTSSSRGSMRLEGDRTAVVYMRGSDCTTTGMRCTWLASFPAPCRLRGLDGGGGTECRMCKYG